MNYCQFRNLMIKRMAVTSGGGLPAKYQAVEYLRGTGTQYIITPITTRSTLTFDVTYQKNGGANIAKVFGGQDANNNNCAKFYANNTDVDGTVPATWRYGSTSVFSGYTTNNIVYTMHATPLGISINGGVVTSCVPAVFTSAIPIRLFDITNGGGAVFVGDIYKFTIAENNAAILDFTPCYRKSDNKPGMYDLVTNTFFTNAGTGEFTVGNNV